MGKAASFYESSTTETVTKNFIIYLHIEVHTNERKIKKIYCVQTFAYTRRPYLNDFRFEISIDMKK